MSIGVDPIDTARLTLRYPQPEDRAPLLALWADPRVMENLGPVKDAQMADATIARHAGYRAQGLGFRAIVRKSDAATIGFCGLKPGAPGTPIAGEVEIGWMLAADAWGQGFAAEAASAMLAWGWATLDTARIVAITAASNHASQRLMERLGMRPLPDGAFDHPDFDRLHHLRRTVTFAIDRAA
ncbi:GNAT family N-acetyltransferase [Sphingomonas sp.]|uniref:GNAT family N-acetyltransferase n=1 Tax=Sphingomonas sp. TaxID=28214 RepID=UPI0035C7AB3C